MCPELFLLGVGKGGSTSLFTFLMEQKLNISVAQNLMPGFRVKEPHYFDLFFAEPLETYASYYPVRRDETSVAIDATPVFTDIHALERIKQRLPSRNLRFIVSFRDPVSRGFSWYLHTVNQFLDRPNFGHMLRSFNTSFSLIAEYTSKEILQCLHRENSIANQAHCVHISNWNPGPRPPTSYIQPANLSEKQLQLAFAYLTAGLYGPILHRWYVKIQHLFHNFPPSFFPQDEKLLRPPPVSGVVSCSNTSGDVTFAFKHQKKIEWSAESFRGLQVHCRSNHSAAPLAKNNLYLSFILLSIHRSIDAVGTNACLLRSSGLSTPKSLDRDCVSSCPNPEVLPFPHFSLVFLLCCLSYVGKEKRVTAT